MRIRITAGSVMTQEGVFTTGEEPRVSAGLAKHLVEIGSAMSLDPTIEKKVIVDVEKKKRIFTVIATGQSLTKEDCEAAHEKTNTIVVNDAWRLLPEADHHYACDSAWWDIHYDDVKAGFKNQSYTIDDDDKRRNPNEKYDLVRCKSRYQAGLDKEYIHYGHPGGGNSGFQACNLAYHLGADLIILLGFDMGGTHFFGNHPKGLAQTSPYQMFIQTMESIKQVEVINCTRTTALNCFPKMSLESALSSVQAQVSRQK